MVKNLLNILLPVFALALVSCQNVAPKHRYPGKAMVYGSGNHYGSGFAVVVSTKTDKEALRRASKSDVWTADYGARHGILTRTTVAEPGKQTLFFATRTSTLHYTANRSFGFKEVTLLPDHTYQLKPEFDGASAIIISKKVTYHLIDETDKTQPKTLWSLAVDPKSNGASFLQNKEFIDLSLQRYLDKNLPHKQ